MCSYSADVLRRVCLPLNRCWSVVSMLISSCVRGRFSVLGLVSWSRGTNPAWWTSSFVWKLCAGHAAVVLSCRMVLPSFDIWRTCSTVSWCWRPSFLMSLTACFLLLRRVCRDTSLSVWYTFSHRSFHVRSACSNNVFRSFQMNSLVFCGLMPPLCSMYVHALVWMPSHSGMAPPSLIAVSAARAFIFSVCVRVSGIILPLCHAFRQDRGVVCVSLSVAALLDECGPKTYFSMSWSTPFPPHDLAILVMIRAVSWR